MISRTEQTLTYAILLLFSIAALLPILGIFLTALAPGANLGSVSSIVANFSLENFFRAWEAGRFSSYMRSSVIVAVAVVGVSTVLSILAGYAFGTMKFRGHKALFYLFVVGIIVPWEALVIPLYYDFRALSLTNTYLALILPQIGVSVAFGTFWMRAFFLSAPRALIEAARTDGASSWTILWRVLVPIGRPAILTLVVLLFMWTWNEFLLALVMVSDDALRTAPLGLSYFQGRFSSDFSLMASGAVIVALPIVIVYVLLQRHFIRGVLGGSVKE